VGKVAYFMILLFIKGLQVSWTKWKKEFSVWLEQWFPSLERISEKNVALFFDNYFSNYNLCVVVLLLQSYKKYDLTSDIPIEQNVSECSGHQMQQMVSNTTKSRDPPIF
jgi:hypothetical protein